MEELRVAKADAEAELEAALIPKIFKETRARETNPAESESMSGGRQRADKEDEKQKAQLLPIYRIRLLSQWDESWC